MGMQNLDLGDLTVQDDGRLGFSVYNKADVMKKVVFINRAGEDALANWIKAKRESEPPEEPPSRAVADDEPGE